MLKAFQSPIGTDKKWEKTQAIMFIFIWFNPLQVQTKQKKEVIMKVVVKMSQSPIGTNKTYDDTVYSYYYNGFQSPIGTQKTTGLILLG